MKQKSTVLRKVLYNFIFGRFHNENIMATYQALRAMQAPFWYSSESQWLTLFFKRYNWSV